jgi:hypothetical protein
VWIWWTGRQGEDEKGRALVSEWKEHGCWMDADALGRGAREYERISWWSLAAETSYLQQKEQVQALVLRRNPYR